MTRSPPPGMGRAEAPPPRDYTDAVPFPDEVLARPIGIVRAPFTERHGTPRQPGFGDGARVQSRIELRPDLAVEFLDDLDGFDGIWVIAWLHLNGPRLRPRVRPPRGGKKRGTLATRAPHRPNPIGLSCVELVGVEGATLVVVGLDLIDGTPVLDIKPYIADFDAHPAARRGWLEEVGAAVPGDGTG